MNVLSMTAKCSDCFNMNLGKLEHYGYVPHSSLGGGDYIELDIDNDTGQILNWKPLTKEDFS
jgi:hypothetical protein